MEKATPKRQPRTHDSDYDGAWEGGLDRHLPACCPTYWPEMHVEIDWDRGVEWRNKELSQIQGSAGSRKKNVDALVKVWLKLARRISQTSMKTSIKRTRIHSRTKQ